MLFGERQAEQAELRVAAPQLAAPAVGLLHETLPRLEAVAIGQQPLDAVLEQALFVAECEIHC